MGLEGLPGYSRAVLKEHYMCMGRTVEDARGCGSVHHCCDISERVEGEGRNSVGTKVLPYIADATTSRYIRMLMGG